MFCCILIMQESTTRANSITLNIKLILSCAQLCMFSKLYVVQGNTSIYFAQRSYIYKITNSLWQYIVCYMYKLCICQKPQTIIIVNRKKKKYQNWNVINSHVIYQINYVISAFKLPVFTGRFMGFNHTLFCLIVINTLLKTFWSLAF